MATNKKPRRSPVVKRNPKRPPRKPLLNKQGRMLVALLIPGIPPF